MIHSGLVSISFRQLNTDEIIDLVGSEGLTGIEWGGDLHVPHGKLDIAQEVAEKTQAAGLSVAAYGSYYMVGVSQEKGLAFDDVLNTAIKLKTDKIRLWAGDKNSEDADADWTKKIVAESKELAKKAADQGVMLVYEFHNNTMTNTYKSAVRLMESIDNPNFQSYWQPINGMSVEDNSNGAGYTSALD